MLSGRPVRAVLMLSLAEEPTADDWAKDSLRD